MICKINFVLDESPFVKLFFTFLACLVQKYYMIQKEVSFSFLYITLLKDRESMYEQVILIYVFIAE